jgi:hypothetical protein
MERPAPSCRTASVPSALTPGDNAEIGVLHGNLPKPEWRDRVRAPHEMKHDGFT